MDLVKARMPAAEQAQAMLPVDFGRSLPQIGPSDIVIAVMGITGSGKSTFINHVVDENVPVGHNLTSCTSTVKVYSFIHRHTQRVFLVDTPGFDDTNRTDTQILKDIALFLSQTYQQKILLSGIIYLHRITDPRMSGSSIRNLNMFKKLCGEDAYKHVTLVTNMWGNLVGTDLSFDEGVRRERQLVERNDWWGLMYRRGSQVVRHTGDKDSVLGIIDGLVALARPVLLTIQKQMVDEARTLEDTDAGQEYEKELKEMKRLHRAQVQELKSEYSQALKDRDTELASALAEQRAELESRLDAASSAQESMKMTLEQLQKEKTSQFQELALKIEAEQRKTARLVTERADDLKRFEDQRRADQQAAHEAALRFEHERSTLRIQIEEMEARSQSAAAEQQREHLRQVEEVQRAVEVQRARDRDEARLQRAQLERRLAEAQAQAQAQAQQASQNQSNAGFLQFLAGAATVVVGAVTEQPVIIAGGMASMASAAG